MARRDFADLLERSRYQIYAESVPTDTLVYSEAEFEQLAGDASSFLASNLRTAVRLDAGSSGP